MTSAEKLRQIKIMMDIKDDSEDTVLGVYLKQAEQEILVWGCGEEEVTVPRRYELVQINAVLAGYNIRGAEGQNKHNENAVYRNFVYEDMVHYIHAHVSQRVRIY